MNDNDLKKFLDWIEKNLKKEEKSLILAKLRNNPADARIYVTHNVHKWAISFRDDTQIDLGHFNVREIVPIIITELA